MNKAQNFITTQTWITETIIFISFCLYYMKKQWRVQVEIIHNVETTYGINYKTGFSNLLKQLLSNGLPCILVHLFQNRYNFFAGGNEFIKNYTEMKLLD